MRFTKSIICLTLFAAFSTAYAGSKYLNGSSGITQNKWDDENIVAGVFWNGSMTLLQETLYLQQQITRKKI